MKRTAGVVFSITLAACLMTVAAFAQSIPVWQPNTAYATGSLVTFNSLEYKCIQGHTSQVGWEPPNVPALWGQQEGPPDFTVSAASTSQSVTVGGSVSFGLSIAAVNGFSGTVTLSASGLPGGAAASFSPSTVNGTGSSTLTITTSAPTPIGSVTITLTGANGSLVHTVSVTLSITAKPSPDFSITATPASQSVAVGGHTSYTVTIGFLNGFSGTVSLNVSGLPAGALATFSPASVASSGASVTSTLSISTATTTPTGNFAVTLTGTSGNLTHNSGVTFGVGSTSGPGNGRLLAGYWHNFDNGTGFIPLRSVSSNFDIIIAAFADASGANISFTPFSSETQAQFISDVAFLKGQGKKVLVSIGGANETVTLNTSSDVSAFVSSVTAMVQKYGFDGIDIDFENASLQLNGNDLNINSPSTPQVVNLISALRQIHNQFGVGFVISMAPETFFAQLAFQFYGPGPFNGQDPRAGAQLAVINNIRDILTYLWVQDYNSGPIEALDGNSYSSGQTDFAVAMTEMLVHGFPVSHNAGTFAGLKPEQVLVGIPANVQAAGSGFLSNAQLQADFTYLLGGAPDGGSYKLANPAGYPNLRGIMAWSINWDSFGGLVFSNGIRSYLNSLPPVQ